MRILDISPITDAAELPIKGGTLQFLQDAHKEMFAAIVVALLSPTFNPATPYILYGCINSGIGSLYNISAGVIFWNGELFYVAAANFTATPSNTAVCSIVTTQYAGNGVNADPVTFTDTSDHNVHNIRMIVVTQGVSGTTIFDFSICSPCNFKIPPQIDLTAPASVGGINNVAQVLGVYPEVEVFVPQTSQLGAVVALGIIPLGDVPGGGVTKAVAFGVSLPAGKTYVVQLTLLSNGVNPQTDTTVTVSVIAGTMTVGGFSIRAQEWTAGVQNLSVMYTCFATN